MTTEIFNRIEELIKKCPSNWASLAADELGVTVTAIRKYRTGELGKKDLTKQVELIHALKKIETNYTNSIKNALV